MWSLIRWTPLWLALLACEFPRPADVASDGNTQSDGGSSCTQNTCTDGVLAVCGTSGTVEREEPCALGCYSDGSRCIQVAPSNGLAQALDQAAQEPELSLPSGTLVNTDTGAVVSPSGDPIAVTTVPVDQPTGAILRVMLAHSWTLRDVQIRGSLPVAFVASGEINVQGLIDASADREAPGPGAVECSSLSGKGGAPTWGAWIRKPASNSGGYPEYLWNASGYGGGGFGTNGGAGGIYVSAGETVTGGKENGNAELVPLRGGCPGGGNEPKYSGGGGGAIQLVGGRAVHIIAGEGAVHVGGGRGVAGSLGRNDPADASIPAYGPGGGGSGGGILIEAPNVVLDAGAMLLASGGGGGGYGACAPGPDGVDAPPNQQTAIGGNCPDGTTPAAAGGAAGAPGQNTDRASAGSGGGGLGRIRINTVDGGYTAGINSVVLGVMTRGALARR